MDVHNGPKMNKIVQLEMLDRYKKVNKIALFFTIKAKEACTFWRNFSALCRRLCLVLELLKLTKQASLSINSGTLKNKKDVHKLQII